MVSHLRRLQGMKKMNLSGLYLILCVIMIFFITGIAFGDGSSDDSSANTSNVAASSVVAKAAVASDAKNAAAEDDKKKQKGLEEQFQEVDPNGAFQYEYPINIPQGTHGMAPTLKLFYNSNCENGMLGMGWTLAGIAKIERDYTYPVNYDNSDHFLYNGERLVYGSDGYYHPAKESFERIELKNPNSGSSYWVITQKDGTKMYFGYQAKEHTASTDGRVEGINVSGSDKAIVWSLSKVVDALGNYYVVEYIVDDTTGAYYPVRITYTKNEKNPIGKYRTIEFSYETRTDHCAVYNPTYIDMQRRLKWITVKVGGQLLKKYRLDYEYGTATGRSRLIAIREYGSDGNCPSVPLVTETYVETGRNIIGTKLSWQDGSTYFGIMHRNVINGKRSAFHSTFADVNGDGKADWISLTDDSKGSYADVSISSGDGTFKPMQRNVINGGRSAFHSMFVDVNGDGKADWISLTDDSKGSYADVSISNGDGTFKPMQRNVINGGRSDFSSTFADVNGDGKADWISLTDDSKGSYADVSISNGDGTFRSMHRNVINGKRSAFHSMFVDVNGDGKADWISLTDDSEGSYSDVSISNGDETFKPMHRNVINGGRADFSSMFTDVNGDGKADWISLTDDSKGSYADISLSSDIIFDLLSTIHNINGGIIAPIYKPAPLVPNAIIPSSSTYPTISNSAPIPLVTQITYDDRLNHPMTYTYNYYNGMIRTGTPSERCSLGFAWIEKTDQNSGTSVRAYYRQDDVDLRLMEDKVEITNGTDRTLYLSKQNTYSKKLIVDNRSNAGLPSSNFIYKSQEDTYNYNGDISGDPVHYQISYGYDDHGNLIQKLDHGDLAVTTDDIEYDAAYDYKSDANISLLTSEQQTGSLLNGNTGLFAETDYAYDSNYLLIQKTFKNNTQDVTNRYGYDNYGNVTTSTDGNHNVTTTQYDSDYQTWVTGKTNPLSQIEKTVYDSLMNPTQTIDVNNITWQTTYDVFSRVKTKVSPGDDSTNPTSRTTYPDEFLDSSGNVIFPRCQKTEQRISGTNYLVVYQYFDGLGRLIQKKTQAKSGSNTVWITVDYLYDNSGRVWKTSVPRFTTASAYGAPDDTVTYTTATYDGLDRVIASLNPDGTTIQTIYGKQDTMRVDENLHVMNKKIVGNVEYDIKYTGTYPSQSAYATTTIITYGDGKRILDAAGNSFIDQMDMLKRKVSSTSPVNGTWTYVYDGNNNMLTQTDAKGNKVRMGYDALNRITKKSYPDGGTVQYDYDEDNHGYAKGHLTQVVYSGGQESYNYDSRGRKISATQTIGTQSRTEKMAYNSMDQIASLTYPGGEVVTYGFDQGGQVASLTGSNSYGTTDLIGTF